MARMFEPWARIDAWAMAAIYRKWAPAAADLLVFHGTNEAQRAGGAAVYGRRAQMRGRDQNLLVPWE